MQRIRVIDSHTEGEPTRVVVEGAPDLGVGGAAERLRRFVAEHDAFRRAVALEPRGNDFLVGALLLPPADPDAVAQVLFFNNVGPLGMCVHGTIGVARTLAWMGRLEPGRHRLETPVGPVSFELLEDGRVAVENVYSHRTAKDVEVRTAEHGTVRGDVAWGGNWFFLAHEHEQRVESDRIPALGAFAWDVRLALRRHGVRGEDGAEIDHVEVFGPPRRPDADSKSFVLCPGGAYDRSPCGTGTSAKLACLAADGLLEEGRVWRQESVIGSLFEGTIVRRGAGVVPTIRGRAWITGESSLILEDDDPYRHGLEVRMHAGDDGPGMNAERS